MRFEERDGMVVIVCGECRRPFARLSERGVRIESRHEHETHANVLTPKDLRQLAEISEALAAQNVLR